MHAVPKEMTDTPLCCDECPCAFHDLDLAQSFAVCLLLLANPISVLSLTPAIALLGFSFVIYVLALMLSFLFILNAKSLQRSLPYGLLYFAQYPHKALVFYGLVAVLLVGKVARQLKPMATDTLCLASHALKYTTPLRVLACTRLAHGMCNPYLEPYATAFLCGFAPLAFAGFHMGNNCRIIFKISYHMWGVPVE